MHLVIGRFFFVVGAAGLLSLQEREITEKPLTGTPTALLDRPPRRHLSPYPASEADRSN
jgi:hypothetical protein